MTSVNSAAGTGKPTRLKPAQDRHRRSVVRSISASFAGGGLQHRQGWARDASADIARQVLTGVRALEDELPAAVRDVVERAGA
jgi:hypothetical protein